MLPLCLAALLTTCVTLVYAATGKLVSVKSDKPKFTNSSIRVTAFEFVANPFAELEAISSRGLFSRQDGCPSGFGRCPDFETSCCPVTGTCCIQDNRVAGMFALFMQ
jgi:hypothetical protein